MCLSKIYIRDTDKDALVVDDAASVINNNGVITVNTLLGNENELNWKFTNDYL